MTPPPWAQDVLLGLDFETTGTDVEQDCPVSATLTVVMPGHNPKQHSWLIDPGREIPEGATRVHGISTERARADGVDPARATDEIAELLAEHWIDGGPPLVIYNAPYDLSIMDRALQRHHGEGLTLAGRRVFDPLVADRTLNRYRKGGHKLGQVCASYGVALKDAHTSDADVLATLRLTYMMASRHPREVGFVDLDELQERQRRWYRDWATNFAQFLGREAGKLERAWIDGSHDFVARKLAALGIEEPPSAEAVAASCAQTRETAARITAGAGHWPIIPRPATVTA